MVAITGIILFMAIIFLVILGILAILMPYFVYKIRLIISEIKNEIIKISLLIETATLKDNIKTIILEEENIKTPGPDKKIESKKGELPNWVKTKEDYLKWKQEWMEDKKIKEDTNG
jgi:hypothetical protein